MHFTYNFQTFQLFSYSTEAAGLVSAVDISTAARVVFNATLNHSAPPPNGTTNSSCDSVQRSPSLSECNCPSNSTGVIPDLDKDPGDFDFEDFDVNPTFSLGQNQTNCTTSPQPSLEDEPGWLLAFWGSFQETLGDLKVILLESFDHPAVVLVFFSLLFVLWLVLVVALICNCKSRPVVVIARKTQELSRPDPSGSSDNNSSPTQGNPLDPLGPNNRLNSLNSDDNDTPHPPDSSSEISSIRSQARPSTPDSSSSQTNPEGAQVADQSPGKLSPTPSVTQRYVLQTSL